MVTMVLFGTSGQIAVTIFIMISSWLMSDRRQVKSVKVIKLMIKTMLISVGVYFIAYGTGVISFSTKQLIKELITPFYMQYWFITCYCIYYFIVPLLNSMFMNKSEDALKKFCLVLTLVVAIYHAIIGGPFGAFIWFIFIHIWVLYIKKAAKSWSNKIIYSGTVILMMLWYIAILVDLLLVRQFSGRISDFLFNLLVYRSLPVLLISIGLFEMGRRWQHRFSARWTKLAAYTLPIYIVHENFIWYDGIDGSLLWNDIFKIENYYQSPMVLIWLPAVIAIMFVFGILFSKIADLIIELLNEAIKKVSEWCDRTFGKIYE